METSKLAIKSCLLPLAMLALLVILTACGSGGSPSSPSTTTGAVSAVALNSCNAPATLFSHATTATIASTVPANGDVNPYGVARVEKTMGNLKTGNILVSNFNNSKNKQGTGSTIVQVAPGGSVDLFAQIDAAKLPGACPGGVGLTTALVVLRSGWVIVGSLPTADGTSATAQAGCLIVLDSMGNPVETISGGLINGPWDMTAAEDNNGTAAQLFVTNVLNGTVAGNGSVVNQGTVVRVDLNTAKGSKPAVTSMTKIGSEFSQRTDPTALVIGPTGVGLSPANANSSSAKNGPTGQVLYVADTLNNRIQVITDPLNRTTTAGTGTTFTADSSLNGPLGLATDIIGNIYTVNGNNGFLNVFNPQGKKIASKQLDSTVVPGASPGAGNLFGLTVAPNGDVYFVDDGTNTLNVLH